MPRIARKILESTYFHIMVQGISKELIFNKDEYKKKYIELIYHYKNKFNIEVFAYCIMENHAHLLLHIDKIEEMSNFMHRINNLYATFYNQELNNRVGHVFRNRFKSQEIMNTMYLCNCIKYIHNNPVKARMVKDPKEYKYSSYIDYYYKKGITINRNLRELVDLDYIVQNSEIDEFFIDIDRNVESIIENVKNKILSKTEKEEISEEEKVKIIEELKKIYTIPYNRSCELLKINERTFRRKKKEMSVLMNVPKTDKGGNYEI